MSISFSEMFSDSLVLWQGGVTAAHPRRHLDECSLHTCCCQNTSVGAKVETQGRQAGGPGAFLTQPDLRHPPWGESSHQTYCIHAKIQS